MSVVEHHDLVPATQPESGVTYSEIRDWAVWLDLFTASDLAYSMGCSDEVAQRGINALLWHGICEDTGGIDTMGDPIIGYIPLPPGPNEHWTGAPEWRTCVQDLIPPHRGMPIRLIDDTKRRNQMQGTKGARLRIKQRDKAYETQLAANEKRAEEQKRRKQNEAQVNKQKGKTKTFAVDKTGKVTE
jgi:hypothetical protein